MIRVVVLFAFERSVHYVEYECVCRIFQPLDNSSTLLGACRRLSFDTASLRTC